MKPLKKAKTASVCPCGKGDYALCCGPLHKRETPAATAEALMRSRYSAYALGLEAYILDTWHAGTRPASVDLSAETAQGKWTGLTVKKHTVDQGTATVHFVAVYKPKSGPAQRLEEHSRFVFEQGRWWYVDGEVH